MRGRHRYWGNLTVGTRGTTLWSGKGTALIDCKCEISAIAGDVLTVKRVETTTGTLVPQQWDTHRSEFWPEEEGVRSPCRRPVAWLRGKPGTLRRSIGRNGAKIPNKLRLSTKPHAERCGGDTNVAGT
jgi:hypothetical protein